MNIKGLTSAEISEKVYVYVKEYFKGSTITNHAGELFQENYNLEYGEIAVDLPQKHMFQDTDQINNTSGFVYLDNISQEHNGYEFIIILLSNSDYSNALYLILQRINTETNDTEHIMLKNFMEREDE